MHLRSRLCSPFLLRFFSLNELTPFLYYNVRHDNQPNDIQHDNVRHCKKKRAAQFGCYAECLNIAQCRDLVVMLSAIMPSAVVLNVVVPSNLSEDKVSLWW
jgi:hypothetical protein